MTIAKIYITADELLLDSFRLGVQIHNSGFKPDFIVGVWRGGTPVGIAIQEILAYLGNESDHIAIRTSSYYGINEQTKEVRVHGIDYLISNMNAEDKLLIVDDVFDSGRSIRAALTAIQSFGRPANVELLVLIAEKQQKTIILSSHDIDICINNALEFLIVSEKKILKTKVSDKQVVIREMEKDVLKSS